MNNILFKNFQPDNQIDLLWNEGLYQGPGPHEIAFIFIFVAFKKIFFLVIALVNIGKLVIEEDMPFASLREEREINSHAFGFKLIEHSFVSAKCSYS